MSKFVNSFEERSFFLLQSERWDLALGPGGPCAEAWRASFFLPAGNSEKVLPTIPCLEIYGNGKSGCLGLKHACKKQV